MYLVLHIHLDYPILLSVKVTKKDLAYRTARYCVGSTCTATAVFIAATPTDVNPMFER